MLDEPPLPPKLEQMISPHVFHLFLALLVGAHHKPHHARHSYLQVFYYKMQGDYQRYLTEFQQGDARAASADKALQAYQSATTLTNQDMAPTHPIRLGLALNFSVFYFEILNSPERACSLAKQVGVGRRCPSPRNYCCYDFVSYLVPEIIVVMISSVFALCVVLLLCLAPLASRRFGDVLRRNRAQTRTCVNNALAGRLGFFFFNLHFVYFRFDFQTMAQYNVLKSSTPRCYGVGNFARCACEQPDQV